MKLLRLTALTALACLAGCETETPPTKTYPRTDPAAIKVLEHYPKQPYETLGKVSYEGPYAQAGSGADRLALGEQTDFLSELRQQAAAFGADAVIIKEKDVYDSSDLAGNGNNNPGDGRRMRLSGIAVKFKAATPPPAGTAPAMAPAGP